MLESKSFGDSQCSEVFDDILFDWTTDFFGFVLLHLKELYHLTMDITVKNLNIGTRMSEQPV